MFTARSRTNEEETPSTRLGRMSLKSSSSSGRVFQRDGSPTRGFLSFHRLHDCLCFVDRQLSIQHMGPRAFGARNAANSDSISNAPSDTEEEEEGETGFILEYRVLIYRSSGRQYVYQIPA
jgi:hypothetical protein